MSDCIGAEDHAGRSASAAVELTLVPLASGRLRVLLADRQEMYLESLSLAVTDDGAYELIGSTTDGFAALELIRTKRPHVAVLDPSLSGLDGLAILKAIERDALATAVVMLTAEPEDRRPYDAIAAGARCYLTRAARPAAISAAITAAATGSAIFDDHLHPALFAEVRRRFKEQEPALDPATREVIELTAAGLNPNQIAAELQVSATTVKTRLQGLYARLGVSSATAAAVEAVRRRLIE